MTITDDFNQPIQEKEIAEVAIKIRAGMVIK